MLLVACANIANLLLARGTTRKAETSIRMALGAARSRLIRQMLTESICWPASADWQGLAVAYAGTRTILALAFPDAHHLPIQASPSLPVLGFAFLLSLVTGVVFGIVPAWITSHSDPAEALRGVNRSTRDRGALPQKESDRVSGRIVAGDAGQCRIADQEPAQSWSIRISASRRRTATWCTSIQPAQDTRPEKLPALYQTTGAAVCGAARRAERRTGALQHVGGQQLGRSCLCGRTSRSRPQCAQWLVVGPHQSEVL